MRDKLVWAAVLICFVLLTGIPGSFDFIVKHGPGMVHNGPIAVILGLALAPGILVVYGFGHFILHYELIPYSGWSGWPIFVFIILFSWIFWRVAWSRTEKALGLWDPFGAHTHSRRPVVLRSIVAVRGWWEILTRFGREATGGWASLIEVLSCGYRDGDIFLGRPRFKIGGGMLRPIGIPTEKHMVTIGMPGSGKSTGGLAVNLMIHKGSLLCVDPKGELARITGARRGQGGDGVQGMGQEVYVLDPFAITGFSSASYNVFDEMARIAERNIDGPVSYAAKVAEALVEITGRDPFWDTAARRVVMGLILYVFQGPAEKRNLVQVRRLLMEGDLEAFEAGVREGSVSREKNDPFDVLLIAMRNCQPGPYHDAIAGSAASLMQMAPNQMGSVLTTAQEHTAFLDLPEIRRVSMKSDFLLEDLKNRPMSVYLSVPINMVSGVAGRWLRMFVLLLIDMMMRVQAAPTPPILLAIDEFPSLGKLDGIEVVAPVMRSYGVRFWAVGQDIEQFEKTYPESWGGFIGGAEAVQFMGVKHPKTVKMVVDFLGQHLVHKQQGEGEQRRTVDEERNLLDANQVSQILYKERKNQIIWRGDRPPMILKVTPYFEYMPSWYYSADPRYPEPWNRRFWRGTRKPPRRPPDDDPPGGGSGPGPMLREKQPPPRPQEKRDKEPVERPPLVPEESVKKIKAPEWQPMENPVDEGASPEKTDFPTPSAILKWLKTLPEKPPKAGEVPRPPEEAKQQVLKLPLDEFGRQLNATSSKVRFDLDPRKMNIITGEPRDPAPARKSEKVKEAAPKPPVAEAVREAAKEIAPKMRTADKLIDVAKPEPIPPDMQPKARRKVTTGDPLDELDNMIGLDSVKAQVRKTISLVKLGKARELAGMPKLEMTHHLVFTGNPGTGKTTVARLVGRIYKTMGVLKSGHLVEVDRGDLVAGFIGHTAPKVKAVFDRAADGVLFIDEAYSLVQTGLSGGDAFGSEAITMILKMMEDMRGRIVVIAAGYKSDMKRFIGSNPGLASRFKTFIDFPDYTPPEMMEILSNICADHSVQMSLDAMRRASALLLALERGENFGNARTVRNIFEECLARQALRLSSRGHYGRQAMSMIEAEDVPARDEKQQ